MDIKGIRIKLTEEYISNYANIDEMRNWVLHYMKRIDFLYRIHEWIVNDTIKDLYDTNRNISYKKAEKNIYATGKSFAFKIEEGNMLKIIEGMAELLIPLIPLGTIVDLKKDHLSDTFDTEQIRNLRFMVDYRYSYYEESKIYLPYGGVVYPLGHLSDEKILYFSPLLIEKVVHMGYKDEMEEAYEVEMKSELILRKRMKSVVFASHDEKEQFEKLMKKYGGK